MSARSGTLTFLFTDIEGHTELWEAHPTAMAVALADHDALVHAVVTDAGGKVVKTRGDGVMAVFGDAGAAVAAAITMQRALADRVWPDVGTLRVRIGLHSGVAEERGGDYFGPDVIRAARVCDAGHGNQILATLATAALVSTCEWVELGHHRLRGIADAVSIHQLAGTGLPERFAPLRTLDAHPNTLPRFQTPFFGREQQIADVGRMLTDHRLVVLTGIGGAGKTRLAIEVAHARLDEYPDGLYFADLGAIADDDRVWDAVATAVQLRPDTGPGSGTSTSERSRERVLRFLRTRRALLVLDNCEHLIDAAAALAEELLDETEHIVVLATSREGLHVAGEHIVAVPSLSIDTEAVEMLRELAAAAGAAPTDTHVLHRICARLDGLPLAIELVAPRCRQLGATEVAARLGARFDLVTGSRRRIARQRTLQATLDWSYDLLDENERSALRRLSVFHGPFSLAGGEAVSSTDVGTIGSLVEKSLIQPIESGRFRLLETVRTYAEDRLASAGESDDARSNMERWLLAQFEGRSDDELYSGDPELARFVALELENLISALDTSADRHDWSTVIRLAAPVALCAWNTAYTTSGPIVDHLSAALDAGVRGEERHRALAGYCSMAWAAWKTREDLWREAAATSEERTDFLAIITLTEAGNVIDGYGHVIGRQAVIDHAGECIARARRMAVRHPAHVRALPELFDGVRALNAKDWSRAVEHLDEALTLLERDGLQRTRIWEWLLYAAARRCAGSPCEIVPLERFAADSIDAFQTQLFGIVIDAVCAPTIAVRSPRRLDRGELDRLPPAWLTTILISVAALCIRERATSIAARLLAAAASIGGLFSTPTGVALYRVLVPELRTDLDKASRDALQAEGRAMGLARALDLAVEWLASEPADA